jgi:hypothetical protein
MHGSVERPRSAGEETSPDVVERRNIMADNSNTDDAPAYHQPPEPRLDLKGLDRLVGTWNVSGPEIHGRVIFEWMEGGFFLIQRIDFDHAGRRVKGIEIIGHERRFGAEPSEEIKSRFYSNTGDTLDYVYELEGDTLTIWVGERGSPAYYRGTFSGDGGTLTCAWHYPGAAVTRRPRPGLSRLGRMRCRERATAIGRRAT